MYANTIRFKLNISAKEYLECYRGIVPFVIVNTLDGRTLQIPFSSLRQFATPTGIAGEFIIYFDVNNKLIGIERAADDLDTATKSWRC